MGPGIFKSVPALTLYLDTVRPGLFMETKTKTFDAVAESSKRKESVGNVTEGMTREEVLAYFARDAVHLRFQDALKRSQASPATAEPRI